MVRLTSELIARGTSGYIKRRRDEGVGHFMKRVTHLYLEDKNIDEVVSCVEQEDMILQSPHNEY